MLPSAGILSILAATLLFGGIAADVVANEGLTTWDNHVDTWIQSQQNPLLTRNMALVTALGDFQAVIAICVMTGFLLWRRRSYRLLTALLLSVPGGMLFNLLLKLGFRRTRPLLEHPVVSTVNYSFPSGHTMAVTLLYGFLVLLAFSTLPKQRALVVATVAAVLVIAVAFSRIYLGAHFLSDVLGAFAAGLAWLLLSFRIAHRGVAGTDYNE
jgi:membrane-associated phospholipid phosphatase